MDYEQFLFTRNKRRDFTAFMRPTDMTNKEVSLLASAFNYVTDVAALTSAQPGLYCFPLGAYTFVLRHYDSGRRHAGREIGVIEGIAVRADESGALAEMLPEISARQAKILDVAGSVGDIEEIEVSRSERLSLTPNPSPGGRGENEMQPTSETESFARRDDAGISPFQQPDETNEAEANDLFVGVTLRLTDEQLVLPFTSDGREMLIEALTRMTSKPLLFAFGTNGDVIGRLAEAGINFDIVGLFGATEPLFRARTARQREAPKVAAPAAPPPLIEPEPITPPQPVQRQRHSLLGKLVGWMLGR